MESSNLDSSRDSCWRYGQEPALSLAKLEAALLQGKVARACGLPCEGVGKAPARVLQQHRPFLFFLRSLNESGDQRLCRKPGAWFRSAGAVSRGLYLDRFWASSKANFPEASFARGVQLHG